MLSVMRIMALGTRPAAPQARAETRALTGRIRNRAGLPRAAWTGTVRAQTSEEPLMFRPLPFALAALAASGALAASAALPASGAAADQRPAPQLAQSHYYVYCANGKIEVDSRDPEQMRSARGSDTCMLSRFNYLSDAQSFARKNFNGVGARCACK
ncbi:MAG: hypothetical protein KIT16_11880 [Rhodospirillaceae bacterium]|nr:hypothetical protein [Rhodospirillaceae bacterium]